VWGVGVVFVCVCGGGFFFLVGWGGGGGCLQFDGSDGCRCQRGYTNVNGICTAPASQQAGGAGAASPRGFGGFA